MGKCSCERFIRLLHYLIGLGTLLLKFIFTEDETFVNDYISMDVWGILMFRRTVITVIMAVS